MTMQSAPHCAATTTERTSVRCFRAPINFMTRRRCYDERTRICYGERVIRAGRPVPIFPFFFTARPKLFYTSPSTVYTAGTVSAMHRDETRPNRVRKRSARTPVSIGIHRVACTDGEQCRRRVFIAVRAKRLVSRARQIRPSDVFIVSVARGVPPSDVVQRSRSNISDFVCPILTLSLLLTWYGRVAVIIDFSDRRS